jgi:translation initiation factor 2B subunit (eIF-2B alpha/beta/delta family)
MSVEDYYTRAKLFCETLKVSNAASQTFCMQTVFNSFASLVEENLNHAKQSEVSMMNAAYLLQQLIEQNNDDETQISMKHVHVPRDIFDGFMVVKKQR